eukprot:gnl/TRDRNA2_/TRDRNA2_185763_c0_seq1.p1 gnl/TRDRNA2_/TRDRNA2_185763_c0~~gnl/TRDRNA2_/TRDRNA2_185763_c0_seq1.p1  ORF type:complete len:356 (-),score=90.62 gnl/TRDRNA2_/TRDRNA2_185763_c0_seq1:216-1283(-)
MLLDMGHLSWEQRLAKCRQEIAEADPAVSLLPESESAPAQGPLGLRKQREELKRLKFVYTAMNSQINFIDGCLRHQWPRPKEGGQSLEKLRKEAKQDNRALKEEIRQEEEVHKQCEQELDQAHHRVKSMHERLKRELQEVERLADAEEAESDEERDDDAELTRPQRLAAENAMREAEQGSHIMSSFNDELARRRKLQDELILLEKRRRESQGKLQHYKQAEAKETSFLRSMDTLLEAERSFGLPTVTFDDVRGVVVLGEGSDRSGSRMPEAWRTVSIQLAEDGSLIAAAPHPALDLQQDAERAVQCDDLSFLLTMVWDSVCEKAHDIDNGTRMCVDDFVSQMSLEQAVTAKTGGA